MTETTITELINQYGYFAIAFLIAFENIFPPIPSELVLVFTGYLTLTSKLTIWGSVLAATAGAFVGAVVLYGVGRLLNVRQIERLLAGRVGKLLRLKPADVDKAAAYFNRRGGWAILIGRCIPVVRSLVSIPAGMTAYPFAKFSGLTILGTLIWNTVLILVGHFAGGAWNTILAIIDQWLVVIIVAVAVILGCYLYYRFARNSTKNQD
ncbi:DedA family protein [Lentilactobacillus parafarraginis]|uniref:SNARE-like domain protein n=2 Tax=Lentilactobacillus parafarraginis TaxID=390842 RepID=A0A0R1YK21_9LACO|nr:DedA family protein [Lentilactobacillus parafarraginis]KRM42447.1 SNARE-like domain protein [Lentilactobacillus parafarraginis DSM 18390 = JCM 14109]TLQ18061.1 DedA family protein [Lentilactobacillus parafarraginis]